MATSFHTYARAYATRLGWPVFPVTPRGKRPCTRHGFKDASADAGTIDYWWRTEPAANVGLPTGPASALVLDIDPRAGGDIGDLPGELPYTPMALTGGKGWHVLFECPDLNCPRSVGPGLDIKAVGGYIVAPPSIHPSGERYRWLVTPLQADLAPVPEWLLDRLRQPDPPPAPRPPRPRGDATTEDRIALAIRYLSRVPGGPQGSGEHGGRDRRTYAAACKLLARFDDLPEWAALDILIAWDAVSNLPPLGERIVREKYHSAQRGMAHGVG